MCSDALPSCELSPSRLATKGWRASVHGGADRADAAEGGEGSGGEGDAMLLEETQMQGGSGEDGRGSRARGGGGRDGGGGVRRATEERGSRRTEARSSSLKRGLAKTYTSAMLTCGHVYHLGCIQEWCWRQTQKKIEPRCFSSPRLSNLQHLHESSMADSP